MQADMGPMLGNRAITGPILVHYFALNGVHFYLIGERHSLNTFDELQPDTYIMRQLRAHTTKNRVRCYSESTDKDSKFEFYTISKSAELFGQVIDKIARSPLQAYFGYHFTKQIDCTNVFCDIRKLSPYNVYTLIVNPMVYMLERYDTLGDPVVEKHVRKMAKKTEKLILKNISNREHAKAFLESLCLADREYPAWFVSLYKELEETRYDPPDTLRDMMREVHRNHPDMYGSIVQHIRSYYQRWAVSPYTLAMARIESMRETRVSQVVAETNADALGLFIEMSSFLLDVYVLLHMVLNEATMRPGDTVCVLSGAAHSEHIKRFFESNYAVTLHTKYDALGRLHAGPPRKYDKLITQQIHTAS
jgi:hypothetical protein